MAVQWGNALGAMFLIRFRSVFSSNLFSGALSGHRKGGSRFDPEPFCVVFACPPRVCTSGCKDYKEFRSTDYSGLVISECLSEVYLASCLKSPGTGSKVPTALMDKKDR